MKKPAAHFTLVCAVKSCQKIIMLTRNHRVDRPVRYGLCAMHRKTIWNHRDAPFTP
jgi:hypothetical protein